MKNKITKPSAKIATLQLSAYRGFFLYSNKMIDQKIDYIHNNPVEAGFVNHAYEWRLSSANEFSPIKVDAL